MAVPRAVKKVVKPWLIRALLRHPSLLADLDRSRFRRVEAAPVVSRLAGDPALTEDIAVWMARHVSFERWQELGFHLLPVHYYSPVPDTRDLPADTWTRTSSMPGVDVRLDEMLDLLRELSAAYGAEFNALPHDPVGEGFHLDNPMFASVDAEMAYALVRHVRPARIVEFGGGHSTLLLAQAVDRNAREGSPGHITVYEPYPPDNLHQLAERVSFVELRRQRGQAALLEAVTSLGANDIIFIDSTHVCRIGSDVQFQILELLPRLDDGVLVHVHDIFWPEEYPKDWTLRRHRFWNEQYVLQAFLAFNTRFRIMWAGNVVAQAAPDALETHIASYPPGRRPGSVWLQVGAPARGRR